MVKNTLPVNFQDDIMNSSMGGKRRYRVINNSDGTISFEDATTYDQVGSNFGAGQMNATNEAVNAAADAGKIIDDIEVIRNVTKEGYVAGALALKKVDESLGGLNFAKDAEGNWGYIPIGADSVVPFKSELKTETKTITESLGVNVEKAYTFTFSCDEIEGIFITASLNGNTCRVLYTPKLSSLQFIIGYYSFVSGIGELGGSSDQNYRTVNITSVNDSTITIRKGGVFSNGTVTINVTALYK